MSRDRSKDSHLRFDPWTVYQNVMGIRIDRKSWTEFQREHFTYWYMDAPAEKKS